MTTRAGHQSGTPSPAEWYRHYTVKDPGTSTDGPDSDTLYVGATNTNATAKTKRTPCAGCTRLRVRFKSNAAGSLAIHFMAPNGVDVYTVVAGEPTAVAVLADTETLIQTDQVFGESWAQVSFTPSATTGSVTLFDIMQI